MATNDITTSAGEQPANVSPYKNHAEYIAPSSKAFFVLATQDIHSPRRGVIHSGQYLLIDPSIQPKDDDMVIVGESLVPFAAQQGIRGVAVSVYTTFR
jgi:hypothetical protein